MTKLIDKKNLIKFLKGNKNKKIVLCHGVFDLVHYGHLKHFKSAKKYGDILIVSITKDKFIKKGFNRPIFNEIKRAEYLSEIEIVDFVYICETESALDSIKTIKPNFYIKGPDYKNNELDTTKKIFLEKKFTKLFNGKIIYTEDKKFSSSEIINSKNLLNYNHIQKNFIEKIKKKYGFDFIKKEIDKFKKLRVLVIGELIFDQYCFGSIIGKSGKEPHLVFKENTADIHVGGVGVIARHISSFVRQINVISQFGNEIYLKKILNQSFSKNISNNFIFTNRIYKSIIKKRFIDEVSNYKMFGSYILPKKSSKNFHLKLISKIKSKVKSSDLVIVSDYGHHFLDKFSAAFISKIKVFKAVNTQLNSSNVTTHSLQNYKNIDLVVINESELRTEFRNENKELKFLAYEKIKKSKIKNLIITQGKNGATLFRKNFIPVHCPAFVEKSIDKVGAGDAMLSMCALAIKQNLDSEIVLFLGSIASAINVNTVGNKASVDYHQLERFLKFSLE